MNYSLFNYVYVHFSIDVKYEEKTKQLLTESQSQNIPITATANKIKYVKGIDNADIP